uniref:Uncharacterized protein n=1 Tax=Plectus sambesii TaxID=2011161 RepID=A0A914UGV1_9BILA
MDDFANALVNPIAAVNLLQKHEEMLKSLTDQDNAADDGVPDDGTGRPPSSDRGSIKNRNDPMGGTFSPLPSSNRSTPSLPTTPVPPNGRSPSGNKGNISRPNIPGFDKVLDADSPRSNSPALTTRPKLSTPTGPGRCLLETYDLNYPTIESLSADRKIDKLRRKHEHDAELLKDRHNKERQQLVKRHQRKIAELEGGGASSQNVGVGLLANVLIRRAKRINRPGESSTITPRRPSAGDSSSLQASHDSELKQLHSKHWKEELQMLQDFENVLKSTLISLSDQSHKTCLRTLDIIFD